MTTRLTGLRPTLMILAALAAPIPAARAGLDDYLKRPEPAYAWEPVSTQKVGPATLHRIKVTSQVWQGITWTHQVSIVEPADIAYPNAAALLITGGAVGDKPRDGDLATGLALANACRARVVVLPQVPNQPLLGDKREDALIAETFVRYLETKDANWPLLFPMVKSAVKAMDAAQAFAAGQGRPIEEFVVTGASKRGWTTWLTGAVDPRVKAIAPMVIPTLNLNAQTDHQLEMFAGKYSEQIQDYTERGIVGRDDPTAKALLTMVDPFTYRDRLALPKLQINGTNDPYWTLDSMNLFWDELSGPKWVVYLPNAGHGLDQHRDYAVSGIGALFRHAIGKTPLPKLSWTFAEADGQVTLAVASDPAPKTAQAWTATSDTLDFRKSPWTAMPLDSSLKASVRKPEAGNVGLFADLQYEVDGFSYHLSTQVHQTMTKPAP
ncbi:PhoPQ-activated pathogenicity-related family protein [Tundrisphaera sp. TA3]|uniref:PhoPQ-activated pathogenicity-related family protein n=1 Tax=Tundrisphaera sp. TA3 TaxID=3435775 RepID=UPI003EB83DEB